MADRTVPIFSIGAVGRMLDLSAATIRTWATRYGYVVTQRSEGGQRLYSRDQVDQLRFVVERIRSAGVKVLPIDLLERPLALLDTARPAL